jgi:signal peptidase II
VSTEQSTEEPGVATPSRRVAVLIGVALLVLALDVLTKYLVVAHLEGGPTVTVIGGLLYFDVIRNSGAAFSMATGQTWLLSIVALGVVVGIVWVAPRLRSVGWAIGLGLVLAGALGNLGDRIFRAPGPLRGHVVDFISVFKPDGGAFAIFNLADSAISVGGVLIVLLALLGRDYDGGMSRQAKERAVLPNEPIDPPTEQETVPSSEQQDVSTEQTPTDPA